MLIHKSSSDGSSPSPCFAPAPFIVGVMRSGTTLLRLMLDTHPNLAIPPETWFIPQVAEACQGASDPRSAFVATLTSHERWPTFQVPEDRLVERVAMIDPFDTPRALRAFFQLYAERFDKPRWGDKTPMYSAHMRLIQALLPEARFIHLIRDGRDVALSASKLRPNADSDKIARTAELWLLRITAARAQAIDLRHYLEIRYEDLVVSPEATLKTVASFIDLPWNPVMLSYHNGAEERLSEYMSAPATILDRRSGDPTAIHRLTSKPPQRERIGVWMREMSASDQVRFADIAEEGLREFGYPMEPGEGYPGSVRIETIR